MRDIGGRRYSVVERRYLLIPERSGTLVIPGARFNGQAAGGFFDDLFGDGRKPLAAAAPAKRLQVRQIPADAPQPWLPLHDLRLRWLQSPREARVGEALTIELEAIADGASAAQLPPLTVPDSSAAQVFADPAQADDQFIDGRPAPSCAADLPSALREAPLLAGRHRMVGCGARVARTACSAAAVAVSAGSRGSATTSGAVRAAGSGRRAAKPTWQRYTPWLCSARRALALRGGAGVPAGPVVAPERSRPRLERLPTLIDALKQGDLAAIAGPWHPGGPAATTSTASARLADAAQRDAILRLQAARWGTASPDPALAALRHAFARGARWRKPPEHQAPLLPPLYPDP